ncbi:MAG: Uma2 family endonuclease [Planctomycetota bacterium]
MTAAETQHLITADEFFENPKYERCELIDGEVNPVSPTGGHHGVVVLRIGRKIGAFVDDHQLGLAFGAETGFLLGRDPDTLRAPDVAFIAKDRSAEADIPKYIPIPPDLAVEVNSPSDRISDVTAKANWWLANGTRQVWVVDPPSRTVTVYHPDGAAHVWKDGETFGGGEVLPGFTLAVGELFGGGAG